MSFLWEFNLAMFALIIFKQYWKARIFLLVDFLEFFSDLGLGGRKNKNKKALKMTS